MILRLQNALFLALRHQRHTPIRSLLLVAAVAVAIFLPVFTWTTSSLVEEHLLRRAQSSPILVGYKGNEFDLVMASIYFRGQVGDQVSYGLASDIESRGYGAAVPLHIGHSANGYPVVGTSVAYAGHRQLEVAVGRDFALLGEVVLGATVAADLGLSPGDSIRTDLVNLYNISGAYPFLLDVVGIYAARGTPDDGAVFAHVKTAWLLDGHFHGHETVSKAKSLNVDEEGIGNLEASAAVFMVNRFDAKTRASFHQHGEEGDLPVSAVLVFPNSRRSFDQILGDFAVDDTLQAVEAEQVIRTVFSIVMQAEKLLNSYFVLVAASTVAFMLLVLNLSLRLRRRELDLFRRMGCSRGTVMTLAGVDLVLIVAGSLVLSLGATAILTEGLSWYVNF